jgi:hypothetical protein
MRNLMYRGHVTLGAFQPPFAAIENKLVRFLTQRSRGLAKAAEKSNSFQIELCDLCASSASLR